MIENLNTKNLNISIIVAGGIGIIVAIISLLVGKNDLFLLLNFNGGEILDFFFKYLTHLGDGLVWILFLAYFLLTKKQKFIPFLICNFFVTTIISQVFKYLIMLYEPRPANAIADQSLIHFTDGVTIHTISSFPSGHTATIFVFAFIFLGLQKTKKIIIPILLMACLVAYSRVYLAQHFPWDIAGGILIVAIPSVLISTWFQNKISKK